MKIQKTIALVSAIALSAGMLSACGGGDTGTTTTAAGATTAAPATTTKATPPETTVAPADTSEQGKVLNIYCWNEEFKNRFISYYPGAQGATPEKDATGLVVTGLTLNDGTVVRFNTTPSDGGAYQTKLDQVLPANASAAADEKVDMYLVEADYAIKYIDTDYALPIYELGISDTELAKQYDYVKQYATDSQGILKGLSWQAAPQVFLYRRSIATQVLGTDDPATVQNSVNSWATFKETAATMKDAGFNMLATPADAFRSYTNTASSPIVVGTTLSVPAEWEQWVDDMKAYIDAGYLFSGTAGLWSADWSSNMKKDGKVFGYFAPPWFVNFSLVDNAVDTAPEVDANGNKILVAGNGSIGDWAVTEGPAPSFWGGTWIVAAPETDNKVLIADIMRALTTNDEIMTRIATDPGIEDFTNNLDAMKAAADSDYKSVTLGGQNPLGIDYKVAATIDASKVISPYGQLAEDFQTAMGDYFSGAADKETALNNFYDAAQAKHPELTV